MHGVSPTAAGARWALIRGARASIATNFAVPHSVPCGRSHRYVTEKNRRTQPISAASARFAALRLARPLLLIPFSRLLIAHIQQVHSSQTAVICNAAGRAIPRFPHPQPHVTKVFMAALPHAATTRATGRPSPKTSDISGSARRNSTLLSQGTQLRFSREPPLRWSWYYRLLDQKLTSTNLGWRFVSRLQAIVPA